jgi:hypothetical protein
MRPNVKTILFGLLGFLWVLSATIVVAQDPLPSWNDTATKKAIVTFVEKVTKQGSTDFVPPPERIATFDNDGTLWVEQPVYTQLAFALDRVKALASKHPEWKTREPFVSLLKGNMKGAQACCGARLMMLVHHDDAEREFAYGPKSKIGTFSDALAAEAKKSGWTVISMKNDRKRIFPFE